MLSTFSNISSETTGPIEAKFHMEPLGTGERKFVQTAWPHDQDGRHAYKIFFSGIKRPMTLKFGRQYWVLQYYQVCSNDDPGLTLTYFTTRSNLVTSAFVWENGKTMDFSATIVVYDFKLATDDRSDKKFLLTSKLCPLGLSAPAPCGYIHVLNHEQNV